MTLQAGIEPDPPPQLALMGAFAFPFPQGSQIFFAEQARALTAAGARPTLLCYGRGSDHAPGDLERITPPAWLAPRAMGSGPRWAKPLADLALLGTWQAAARRAGQQQQPFEFVLAHNAEAAIIALAARRTTRVRVVYVAHTLLQHELSAYLPERLAREAGRAGQQIERSIARRADGVITLCEATQRALSPHARADVALIPPSFEARPAPNAQAQAQSCQKHGLVPGHYTLYSGNLDRYQELDLLARAASQLPVSAGPLVVATHALPSSKQPNPGPARLLRVRVRDFEEMRHLIHAAGCLVAPRRRIGGFPIKLLNYMEAGRPIVAFAGAAPGLKADESAWIIAPEDPGVPDEKDPRSQAAHALTHALTRLSADPELGRRLGAGARRQLETRHPGRRIAAETLDYLAGLPGPFRRPNPHPPRC